MSSADSGHSPREESMLTSGVAGASEQCGRPGCRVRLPVASRYPSSVQEESRRPPVTSSVCPQQFESPCVAAVVAYETSFSPELEKCKPAFGAGA